MLLFLKNDITADAPKKAVFFVNIELVKFNIASLLIMILTAPYLVIIFDILFDSIINLENDEIYIRFSIVAFEISVSVDIVLFIIFISDAPLSIINGFNVCNK